MYIVLLLFAIVAIAVVTLIKKESGFLLYYIPILLITPAVFDLADYDKVARYEGIEVITIVGEESEILGLDFLGYENGVIYFEKKNSNETLKVPAKVGEKIKSVADDTIVIVEFNESPLLIKLEKEK